MSKRRTSKRVPGMRRAGGWRTIESLLYEKHGVVFAEGERVVTALPVASSALDSPGRRKGGDDAA
jgi:hypothetical protein